MLKRSITNYIFFGTAFRYLQDAKEGYLLGEQGSEDGLVRHCLARVLNRLETFELHVTRRAAVELETFLEEMEELPKDHKLTADQAKRLSKIIKDIRLTLEAETLGNVAFIVTDKRIDVEKLLDDVAVLFAPGAFEKLPGIAQYDFAESGKCIAFERPTAAAFHCLRGTEAALRHYYCSLVKKGRGELMWGPIVTSLRRSRKSPPAVMLSNLDNIRESFRNPTTHPEARYDISEVQDLFNLCVDVVNRMVKDLEARGMA